MKKDLDPPEVITAYNETVLPGNLLNHVRFWTFLGFVFFVAYGVTKVVIAVPAFVNQVMGIQ